MPLFFLIAIGAGALTLGATAIDPAADVRHQNTAQVQTTSHQATVYATMEDCVRAMAAAEPAGLELPAAVIVCSWRGPRDPRGPRS